MSIASIGTLVWRHPLADVAAKSAARWDAAFTFCIADRLRSGAARCGAPIGCGCAAHLGAGIVPDLYLGVIALWRHVDDPSRAARAPRSSRWSGAVNLRSSSSRVERWNTLHQPASVFRFGGPAIATSILMRSP